jgi:hypothetical protein
LKAVSFFGVILGAASRPIWTSGTSRAPTVPFHPIARCEDSVHVRCCFRFTSWQSMVTIALGAVLPSARAPEVCRPGHRSAPGRAASFLGPTGEYPLPGRLEPGSSSRAVRHGKQTYMLGPSTPPAAWVSSEQVLTEQELRGAMIVPGLPAKGGQDAARAGPLRFSTSPGSACRSGTTATTRAIASWYQISISEAARSPSRTTVPIRSAIRPARANSAIAALPAWPRHGFSACLRRSV